MENADALRDSLLTIEATKWQYTNGVRNPEVIAPDSRQKFGLIENDLIDGSQD